MTDSPAAPSGKGAAVSVIAYDAKLFPRRRAEALTGAACA
jgi:hypothetical protein